MKISKFYIALSCLLFLIVLEGCRDDEPSSGDLTYISYNPVPYNLLIPEAFKNLPLEIPADNPMTEEGVQLGRRLFYDPILSVDSTISCSSCHGIKGGFTDNLAVSPGVNGTLGTRSSMSLLNVAFMNEGLFWDGRAMTLEDQAQFPILDPVEFNHSIPGVVDRLQNHGDYKERFRKAFGIANTSEIDIDLTVKALAQFERTIIGGGDSNYDRFIREEYSFTDDENNGFEIFFDFNGDLVDGECAHCHPAPLFTDLDYVNNGLDSVPGDNFNLFPDVGRGAISGRFNDNGRFKTTSLRNITLTAPYMHDGRFSDLSEVMDHYGSGGLHENNIGVDMPLVRFTDQDKFELLAFLNTLVDTSYYNNPILQNPF